MSIKSSKTVLTQLELDRLMTDGRAIAQNSDTYELFIQNRDAVLFEAFLNSTLN